MKQYNELMDADIFDQILSPLETVIVLIYTEELKDQCDVLFNNYKTDVLVSTTSRQSIQDLLGTSTKSVLTHISKKYRRSLLDYFSEQGLVRYIYSNLKHLVENGLTTLVSNTDLKPSKVIMSD